MGALEEGKASVQLLVQVGVLEAEMTSFLVPVDVLKVAKASAPVQVGLLEAGKVTSHKRWHSEYSGGLTCIVTN